MGRILIGNIKGPQGEQGEQGIQGPVGPQGPQGPLPPLINNALATVAGVAALDAVMGGNLQSQITSLNRDLVNVIGINPKISDLVAWASDDARRRIIWRLGNSEATGFPDDTHEWCVLNMQDETAVRGVVVAFSFGGASVKYRSYFNKTWLTAWITII